jgi:hypothetical protein
MTNETTKETKRPTHEVFQVTGEGDRARWTKIGIAFTHKGGKGLNILLDAVPLTGRTVALPIEPRQERDNGGQQ